MAEKKSAHHDEFMKLHMFKEDYIEKLESMGIKSPEDLADALEDEEKTKQIHEHLKGAGPKTIEHWKEDLGVVSEEKVEVEPEEKEPAPPAPKTRKVKAAAKKVAEPKAEKKKDEEQKEEAGEEGEGAEEKPAEKKEEEEVEIEEEEGYKVKLKPKLSKETLDALKKRAEVRGRRPEFLRQEWHRRKCLQTVKWRKPQGDHSKMRQHYAYRPNCRLDRLWLTKGCTVPPSIRVQGGHGLECE